MNSRPNRRHPSAGVNTPRLSSRRLLHRLLSCLLFCAALALLLGAAACSGKSSGSGALDADGQSITDRDLELEAQRFGDGNIPYAKEGGFFDDIYFDYDSAAVSTQYHEQIRQNAQVIRADPSLRVEIEGHCDKRGTNEYNLALGDERAKAVAALLVSYGVNPDQLTTISYGEEIPVDPGDNESAYAKNRRVHFALFRQK